jgi:hypothetical protein
MIWIIILFIILLLAWILVSPLELKIDTRIPEIIIRWRSIGRASVVYENDEWWLYVHLLFYNKNWSLMQMIFADKKNKKEFEKIQSQRKKSSSKWTIERFFKIIRTFKISQLKIAIGSSDNAINAKVYPLNFLPQTQRHLYINFEDENYLLLTIKNQPFRIIYALMT